MLSLLQCIQLLCSFVSFELPFLARNETGSWFSLGTFRLMSPQGFQFPFGLVYLGDDILELLVEFFFGVHSLSLIPPCLFYP